MGGSDCHYDTLTSDQHFGSVGPVLHFGVQFICDVDDLSLEGTLPLTQLIKTVHLKYFSFNERKKYDDAQLEDPDMSEISISTRLMVSFVLFLLNFSRFLITFVAPLHRKRI